MPCPQAFPSRADMRGLVEQRALVKKCPLVTAEELAGMEPDELEQRVVRLDKLFQSEDL